MRGAPKLTSFHFQLSDQYSNNLIDWSNFEDESVILSEEYLGEGLTKVNIRKKISLEDDDNLTFYRGNL